MEDVFTVVIKLIARALGYLLMEVIIDIFIRGPGYLIVKWASKKEPDPGSGWIVLFGLLFWLVIGCCLYILL